MRTLHLTLKKEWFLRHLKDKQEDYRAIDSKRSISLFVKDKKNFHVNDRTIFSYSGYFNQFDRVKFVNGYGAHRPYIVKECKVVYVGYGNTEWGAPTDKPVFIIYCGKIIESGNLGLIEPEVGK